MPSKVLAQLEKGIEMAPTRTHRSEPVAPTPSPWSTTQVIERLEPLYGPAEIPRGYDAISELVYTILSQNTSDINSTRAYSSLLTTFSSWDDVADAPRSAIVDAIKIGGLAQIKGPRIQDILQEVRRRIGNFDLSFLSVMPLDQAKAWLRELPGVGPKTVGCVLLFALHRPALPVDTHVYRMSKRLGLFAPEINPNQSHDVLEGLLTEHQILPFHMHLINHGRKICKAQRPVCSQCILEERCPSSTLGTRGDRKQSRAGRG